jgi:hypothetical protein
MRIYPQNLETPIFFFSHCRQKKDSFMFASLDALNGIDGLLQEFFRLHDGLGFFLFWLFWLLFLLFFFLLGCLTGSGFSFSHYLSFNKIRRNLMDSLNIKDGAQIKSSSFI